MRAKFATKLQITIEGRVGDRKLMILLPTSCAYFPVIYYYRFMFALMMSYKRRVRKAGCRFVFNRH